MSQRDEMLEIADRIVKMAKDRGATVAECAVRSGEDLSAKLRLGEPELVEQAGHRSAGLRIMKDGRVAITSTSDLSKAGIERFVADGLELADLSEQDPFAGPADPSLICDPTKLADLDLFDATAADIDAEKALVRAREAEDAMRAFDARITNSDGSTVSRSSGASALALSSGFRGFYKGSYVSLSVVGVADDEGGKKRRGSHWTARRHVAELDDAAEVGREAARRTVAKLGARSVATGEYPVVFDPDAARGILGYLGGCLMGGSIWRKSSYLVGREGTKIASELIDIVDDPLIPRAPGSRAYDGEGLASRRNVVVEKGILQMYLCDSYAARKLGRASTASASRSSSGGVGASTTNFILQAGKDSPESILKGTKRGLYVTSMMGFGFNAITGDFSRGASGFWIENGELAFPVSEVTISLNIDDIWKRIDAVGTDADMRTSTVSPTFRVERMTVAGSSNE